MQSEHLLTTGFSRLDPETTARIRRGTKGKATRTQSAVEYGLFIFFGVTIVLSLIALIVVNSPQHKMVPNRVAAGVEQGRVNILVIGTSTTPGGIIDTDSLLLLSVKPKTHQIATISVPRDLWVKLGRYGTHRLAAAEAVGQASGYPGEGTGLTADTVEQITGQPVHAYVRLEGPDLQSLIDAIGGVDIDVKHNFYEAKVRERFLRGVQHMDGERAARFAKSRHVIGPQNDRFAREMREQQVIVAVLEKLETLPQAQRDRLLRSHVFSGSSTNLESSQIALLTDAIHNSSVQEVSLEPLMTVIDGPSLGDSDQVVQPRGGDFTQLQSFTRDVFGLPVAVLR
jgi:LCP family protein required for cell wall assembly